MNKEININELFNRDLEEYNRISSMLSKSVHDINNPLAVFIGQISIIELLQQRGQLDDDKMEKILDKFKTSSDTLKERIGYLRNYYKVLINDNHFPKLENAVASACYMFENEAYLAGIDYKVVHLPEVESIVESNKIYLMTKHLVQNAIESVKINKKEGGIVEVNSEQTPDGAKISVRDNGPGLMCDLDLAKELGYTTKANKTGGTGLAIINKILNEYKIELEYDTSNGCCFSFTLPLK